MPVDILLIEDSPADAELALVAIRRSGFGGGVTHIPDGDKALDWLRERIARPEGVDPSLPAVALVDLKLPGCDGLEVLRQVKATPRLCRLPVVVFTSSREERDITRAYDLGCNAYVVKPVEFSAYCEAVAGIVAFWAGPSQPPSYSAA